MDVFADEFVPSIQTANKTNYNQWRSQNPGEATKWEKFRDDVIAGKQVTPPVLVSKYGKALVAAGKLQMSVTDIGANWNPPPVTSGLLTWKPPNYVSGDPKLPASYNPQPTVLNLTSANSQMNLPTNQDFLVNVGNFDIAANHIEIQGGRNVTMIGGRVFGSAYLYYLAFMFQNPVGTVHIEGLNLEGPYPYTAMSIRTGSGYASPSNAIIQIQNCRIEGNIPPGGSFSIDHPDSFQFEGNGTSHAFTGTLRMDMVTQLTCNTGLNAGTYCAANNNTTLLAPPQVYLKRCNFRPVQCADVTSRATVRTAAFITQWYRESYTLTLDDDGGGVWGETGVTPMFADDAHSVIENCVQPISTSGRVGPSAAATTAGIVYPGFVGSDKPSHGTDALGDYCTWPVTAHMNGKFRQGIPPGGDYCPTTVPGVAYVSPGYV